MEAKNLIEIKNKRAAYEYFLMDEYTAGLVLMGSEIKSIREGKANLSDAWCTFVGNELFVRDMHISEYKFGSYWGHQAKRDRKLLLTRRELRKLQNKIKRLCPSCCMSIPAAMPSSLSPSPKASTTTTSARPSRPKTRVAIWKGNWPNQVVK